jgi:hypothetical protein
VGLSAVLFVNRRTGGQKAGEPLKANFLLNEALLKFDHQAPIVEAEL